MEIIRFFLAITVVSLISWVFLLFARGEFWKVNSELDSTSENSTGSFPSIRAIIPARNEREVLPKTLPTVLNQDYPGDFDVILVDDQSTDGTGEIGRRIARETESRADLEVVEPPPTPDGWAGKVWALHNGFQRVKEDDPDLIWLTDADIAHETVTLKRLTNKLTAEELGMASIMADLRTESFWEKTLIPNFIYFFKMLFPFNWVNHPEKDTAAAAGGCILLRKSVLERAGGFESLSGAVIDDCSLARNLRDAGETGLWLGQSHLAKSVREYGGLRGIWNMVSRSAFSQLNHSTILLLGTVLGMALLFLVPPIAVFFGLTELFANGSAANGGTSIALTSLGGSTWIVMAGSFLPILNWYGLSPIYGLISPLSGLLYTLMTLESGLSWWRGKGGEWKGRTFSTRKGGR